MALEFGFNRYNRNSPEEDAVWNKVFDDLAQDDKDFFHNSLPWILMFTDIGQVTTLSIPHIVKRLIVYDINLYRSYLKDISVDLEIAKSESPLETYLIRFIGFTANVATLTSSEFIKKRTTWMKREVPHLAQKDIAKISKVLSGNIWKLENPLSK